MSDGGLGVLDGAHDLEEVAGAGSVGARGGQLVGVGHAGRRLCGWVRGRDGSAAWEAKP